MIMPTLLAEYGREERSERPVDRFQTPYGGAPISALIDMPPTKSFVLYEFSRQRRRTFNPNEEEILRRAVERFLRGGYMAGTKGRAMIAIQSSHAASVQQRFYDRLHRKIDYEPRDGNDVHAFGFLTSYPADRMEGQRTSAVVAETCRELVPYGFSVRGYAYPEAFKSRRQR